MVIHETAVSGEFGDFSSNTESLSEKGSEKIWLTALRRAGLTIAAVGGGALGAMALGFPAYLFSDGIARMLEDETFKKAIPPVATALVGLMGFGAGAFHGWAISLIGLGAVDYLVDNMRRK